MREVDEQLFISGLFYISAFATRLVTVLTDPPLPGAESFETSELKGPDERSGLSVYSLSERSQLWRTASKDGCHVIIRRARQGARSGHDNDFSHLHLLIASLDYSTDSIRQPRPKRKAAGES